MDLAWRVQRRAGANRGETVSADDRAAFLRILGLILEVSEAAFNRVPPLFRPAGIQEKLEEIGDLIAQLKRRRG